MTRAALICLLGALAAGAAEPQPISGDDPFIQAFIARQQATATYRADLRQTLHLRGLREPVESAGQVYFQAPGRLALLFTQPPGEYLILDRDSIYLKKTNQPLRRQPIHRVRQPGRHDILFLRDLFEHGATNTLAHYSAELVRADADVIVTLTPRQRQPRSREPVKIENWIRAADHELHRLRVHFENDNSVTYQFLNPARDAPVDPARFVPVDRLGPPR